MSKPCELTGKWVLCHWNFDAKNGYPHPNDADLFPEEWLGGCVAECLGTEGDFIVLAHEGKALRVVPFSVKALPSRPKFLQGQKVKVRSGNFHSPYESSISSIIWHHKDEQYLYFLAGKSTRYYETELEPAS